MFTLHSHGGSRAADSPAQELRREPSTGPLDGELIDLYAAILIAVPVALLLKALLF